MRLFVALNLPDTVRRALWDGAAPLRDAGWPVRWVRPEGIHLTLKFLGAVEPEQEPALRAALAAAAGGGGGGGGGDAPRPLTLALEGFGVFPDVRRPRVFWGGVAPDGALELLQHRVEREFAPLGFPTEARPFHPHVTLGRATREARAGDFARLGELLDRLVFTDTATVETLDLMESTLRRDGAVYHLRASGRLS